MHSGFHAVTTVLLAAFTSSPALAQEPIQIPNEPSCDECRLRLERILTVEDDSAGRLGGTTEVAMGSRYIYVASERVTPGQISVFDLDGKFVELLGRHGEGPGEFREAWCLVANQEDKLSVFDMGNARMTVFSPEREVTHESRFHVRPLRWRCAMPLADGRYVISAGMREGAETNPLVIYDPQTEELSRPFVEELEDPNEYPRYLLLATTSSSGIWTVDRDEYVIDKWSLDGARELRLVRDPDWWEPRGESQPRKPGSRPAAIHFDVDGLLWVISRTAGEHWERYFGPDGEPTGDLGEYIDTVIEVIDPATGKLLVSDRFTEGFSGFFRDGLIYSWEYTEVGVRHLVLWRVALEKEQALP